MIKQIEENINHKWICIKNIGVFFVLFLQAFYRFEIISKLKNTLKKAYESFAEEEFKNYSLRMSS